VLGIKCYIAQTIDKARKCEEAEPDPQYLEEDEERWRKMRILGIV
jgi:hypothetical protein